MRSRVCLALECVEFGSRKAFGILVRDTLAGKVFAIASIAASGRNREVQWDSRGWRETPGEVGAGFITKEFVDSIDFGSLADAEARLCSRGAEVKFIFRPRAQAKSWLSMLGERMPVRDAESFAEPFSCG